MLADLVTRVLVMVLGYAYPAFECFKTAERNNVQIEELRFWCQYWIIVALLTVLERICDIFVSWVPMYAEMKLAVFLYLWYPKTKGTRHIYEALLRPFVSKHETDIDKGLQELRTRAWDLAIYYYHNCTELGQSKFFQIADYLASQSGKLTKSISKKGGTESSSKGNPPPPPPPNTILSFNQVGNQPQHDNHRQRQRQQQQQQHPIPSAPPLFSDTLQDQFGFTPTPETASDHNGHGSRFRIRRGKGSH